MERPHPDKSKRRLRIAYLLLGVAAAFIVLGCAATAYVPSDAEIPADDVTFEESPTPEQADVTPDPALDTPGPTLAPTPTPTPTPTPEPTPTPPRHPLNGDALMSGDEEPIVLDIQIRLMELDYLDFEQPDDEYSDGTADAIRAFQVRNGLHANGICDKETFEKLFSDDALTYAMVRGSDGDDVEIVKERLIELGYLSSKSDLEKLQSEEWRMRVTGSMAKAVDLFFSGRATLSRPVAIGARSAENGKSAIAFRP